MQDSTDSLENYPEMLSAKLLFFDSPVLEAERIKTELKLYFSQVSNPDDSLMFFFPDIKIELQDATIPAQCTILIPNEGQAEVELPPQAFQQNWHWMEAAEVAKKCNYEILITDFMTRTLDYRVRLNLFVSFLTAVTKALNPQAIYSASAQKLISPSTLIESWDDDKKEALFAICNVRLFNLIERNELLMDTLGLSNLGLPDFQIRFKNMNEGQIAGLLWNYAYYLFEQGDVINDGNTIAGLEPNSKWICEKQVSLVAPERVVFNLQV